MFAQVVRQVIRQLSRSTGFARSSWRVGGVALLLLLASVAQALPPGTSDEIRSRLAGAGQLCRAGDDCGVTVAAAPTEPRSGQQVYDQFCVACHSTGVGGAPKTGDIAAWEPRIGKGLEALWTTMQNGLNAMPAKGTCMSCSEDELRASMNFLVESGQ